MGLDLILSLQIENWHQYGTRRQSTCLRCRRFVFWDHISPMRGCLLQKIPIYTLYLRLRIVHPDDLKILQADD